MAMNAETVKTAVKAKLTLAGFDFDNEYEKAEVMVDAIVDEIISHIKDFAVVSSTVAVTSVSAVTVGAGVSGPGAGTATGTVS